MSPRRGCLLALALLIAGCAGERLQARRATLPPPAPGNRAGTHVLGAGPGPGPGRVQARRVPLETAPHAAVEVASGLVGAREIVVGGVEYGDGCAALVRAAYASAGVAVEAGDAAALHSRAAAEGRTRRHRPAAGDLVFLADRPGGPAEHVGLVERVGTDGTVVVLHRLESGVARVRLNGTQPWKARDENGKTLNDVLIVGAGRVTVARLLVGYASVR